MSKIRILVVAPDKHGVGKFRTLDPFKFIGEKYSDDIHVDISFGVDNNDSSFNDYNIVIFHSFIHNTIHEHNVSRVKWLQERGVIVIMDIDDLWFVDQRHPMFHQVKETKTGDKKAELLRMVNYVTTTTPIFAKTLKERLNIKNVIVFPNAVNEDEPQFQPKPRISNRTRFGWLGGSSHLHDIDILKNGISSVQNLYKDKTQFVLCGFDLRGDVNEFNPVTKEVKRRPILPKESVWYQYEKIFTDDYRVVDQGYKNYLEEFTVSPYLILPDDEKPYIRRWTEEVTTYANNYNYFDISLAPLLETFFNSNKSQLKVIEAGFHKKALIASEVDPYTLDLVSAYDGGKYNEKGNCLLVSPKKNHKQWAQHMKRLVENPNLIKDLGEKLYETVKDKYSLKKVCKDRVEFLKTLVK